MKEAKHDLQRQLWQAQDATNEATAGMQQALDDARAGQRAAEEKARQAQGRLAQRQHELDEKRAQDDGMEASHKMMEVALQEAVEDLGRVRGDLDASQEARTRLEKELVSCREELASESRLQAELRRELKATIESLQQGEGEVRKRGREEERKRGREEERKVGRVEERTGGDE